jgi:hypothetical protein
MGVEVSKFFSSSGVQRLVAGEFRRSWLVYAIDVLQLPVPAFPVTGLSATLGSDASTVDLVGKYEVPLEEGIV